jgi:hypothetical protein
MLMRSTKECLCTDRSLLTLSWVNQHEVLVVTGCSLARAEEQ